VKRATGGERDAVRVTKGRAMSVVRDLCRAQVITVANSGGSHGGLYTKPLILGEAVGLVFVTR
jgi:hypothetical protein